MLFNKYIDYNLYNENILFYIAIIFLILAHLVHYQKKNKKTILIFKSFFIVAYIILTISEIISDKKINISTIIYRIIIILLVFISMYIERDFNYDWNPITKYITL